MKKLDHNYYLRLLLGLFAISILIGWPFGGDLNLVIRLIIFAGILCFMYMSKKNQFVVDENNFSQNNVAIVFDKQQIIIKGKSYHVNQVNKISIGNEKLLYTTPVFIQLDNFETYEISIKGRGEAKKFVDRLKLALRKSGRLDLDI